MNTFVGRTRILTFAILASLASLASAATINVPADYPDIIDAVFAANPGDTILIQSGTYNENGQVIVWAPMTLTATNGPVTIHATPDQEAVVEVVPGISNVVFNGIIIDRPSANSDWMRGCQVNSGASATFNNCSFSGPANDIGVILFFGASATLNSCTFSNFNPVGTWSAAIYLQEWSPGQPETDLIMTNCTFDTGCNGWIRVWYGAADLPHIGNLIAEGCTFKSALNPQALAFTDGGYFGIGYNPTNALLFQDCSFEGSAKNYGGLNDEIEFYYTTNTAPPSLTFSRCNFKAYDSYSYMMYLDIPTPITFENCLFAGGHHDSVIRVWGGPSTVNLDYCTMINEGMGTSNPWAVSGSTNESAFLDGWDGGRTFNITDSLFRCPTNFSAGFVCDPASAGIRNYAVSHSVIDHPIPTGDFAEITLGADGYTNVSLASAFVDPANENYQLTDGSPWVNGGIDLGYTLDLAGNPRIQGGAPDMGAYESAFAAAPGVSIVKGIDGLTITFTGVLQSADAVSGPFNDVTGATSPLTIMPTNGSMFWRARSQ